MKFWKRAILINLAIVLAVVAVLAIFFATPFGRPVFKTILLIPEVLPEFPVKPLKFFSKEPKIEEISLQIPGKEIKADLYRPNDNKRHPGLVVALGTDVTRKNSVLVPVVHALARLGFVVLVPDLPDFISGFVWTDSSEALISSFEFLEKQNFIVNDKMGFFGFCVGGSQSIVVSEDPRISERVSFVIALTPYYNLFSLTEKALAGGVRGEYGIEATIKSVQKGFINYIEGEKERQLLLEHFIDGNKLSDEELDGLSSEAKSIYQVLSNQDRENFANLWQTFPPKGKELLSRLSPDTKIDKLKAKLYILYDKGYTFIPKSEAELWEDVPANKKISIVEIQSFQHVTPQPNLPRWELTKLSFQLFVFIYKVFLQLG